MRPDKILSTTLLSIQRYQNWREILFSIAKKQYPTRAFLRNGARFEANVGFLWLIDEIFFHRVYTPRHLEIEKNDVVVDIGAHIGVFTIFAASRTQQTVYACEPTSSNFELLKHNILLNGLKNIVPYSLAVSGKNGFAPFICNYMKSTNNLLSSQPDQESLKCDQLQEAQKQVTTLSDTFEEYIEVPTTTLQAIMDNNSIGQIGFLKMDCEGAEGVILSTTPVSYLKKVKKIALEFHDHLSTLDHKEIRKLLEEREFRTELRWDGKSSFGYLYAWREASSSEGEIGNIPSGGELS